MIGYITELMRNERDYADEINNHMKALNDITDEKEIEMVDSFVKRAYENYKIRARTLYKIG